jgi:hypothetical protein
VKHLRTALRLLTQGATTRELSREDRRHVQVIRRQCAAWLRSPAVLGFGIGYRETARRQTNDLALRVHVVRKLPRTHLRSPAIPAVVRLPGFPKPIPIDVVEGDVGRPQLALCGDGLRLAGGSELGTIGVLVKRRNDPAVHLLTCRHVLEGPLTTPVEWLEFPPAPALPNPQIGTLSFLMPLSGAGGFPNLVDAALAEITPSAVDALLRWIGPINGVRTTPVVPGERVRLCGYGSSLDDAEHRGVVEGEVTEVNARQTFSYPVQGALGFDDLVLCTRYTRAADSGAAVLDEDGALVGLHVGASRPDSSKPWSAFTPIRNVFGLMRLSLFQGPTPAPPAPAVAAIAPTPSAPPAVRDRALAIDTLGRTLFGEARGEPPAGKAAVANVVVNRVRVDESRARANLKMRFGGTVEGVCQRPLQFSCWNANDPNRAVILGVTTANAKFVECLDIARRAVDGTLADNTKGSTHYHAASVSPNWAQGHTPVVTLGSHRFYNDVA